MNATSGMLSDLRSLSPNTICGAVYDVNFKDIISHPTHMECESDKGEVQAVGKEGFQTVKSELQEFYPEFHSACGGFQYTNINDQLNATTNISYQGQHMTESLSKVGECGDS